LYSEDNFASPLYQTLQGQLFIEARANLSVDTEDRYAGPVLTQTQRHTSYFVEDFARYGLTDRLSAVVSLVSDANTTTDRDVATGLTTQTRDGGPADLHLGFVDRVTSEPDSPVYFDVRAEFISHFRSAMRTILWSPKIGRVFGDLTLQASTTVQYNWSNRSGSGKHQTVSGVAFLNIADRWSIKGTAEYDLTTPRTNFQGLLSYDVIPGEMQLQFGAGHSFIPNSLVRRDQSDDFVEVRLDGLLDISDHGTH
jgi:hypothetical protein